MTYTNKCTICGEPVESPWRFHGYSGPCPKPPLEKLGKVGVEPVGFWQGEFSKDGGAVLYEVPQESVFGRKYLNAPLYPASALAALRAENERLKQKMFDESAAMVGIVQIKYPQALAERDTLRTQLAQAQEDLHDERNRGLSLLADAKEWQRQFNAAQATIETLRYEVDAIPAIKEGRDAAQADAARYRWLRSYNTVKHERVTEAFFLGDEHLDAAIDAAMQGETK